MRLPRFKRVSARLTVCVLAFAAGVACFLVWQYGRARPAAAAASAQTTPAPAPTPSAAPVAPADPPVESHPRGPVGKIDFKNFTYPSPSAGKRVTVRNGELEYPTDPGCGQTFSVEGVDYIDFTGDGEDEALVRFIDHQACGSSWVSVNYFVYTVRKGRPRLLWRFATGSEAFGGEKEFRIDDKELVFELYGTWRPSGGDSAVYESEKGLRFQCDRCTNHYSVYRVAWDGRRFRRRSLEVVECPGGCQFK